MNSVVEYYSKYVGERLLARGVSPGFIPVKELVPVTEQEGVLSTERIDNDISILGLHAHY